MYSDCLKGVKMANSNLEVKVTCGLNIDTESADFALKAVNIYCNKNGYRIKENPLPDRLGSQMEFVPQEEGCIDCYGHRENVLYTKSGKEKIAYFCPTCGRKLQ